MPRKHTPFVRDNIVDKDKYYKAKAKIKRRFKVYPSAYANAALQREYKRMGGRYKGRKSKSRSRSKSKKRTKQRGGSLTRWFDERWVNVCEKTKSGRYKSCGRSKASKNRKRYPYCRPSKRISKSTPKTVKEMSSAEIKRMCKRKRSKAQGVRGKPTRVYVSKRKSKRKSKKSKRKSKKSKKSKRRRNVKRSRRKSKKRTRRSKRRVRRKTKTKTKTRK